MQVLPGPRSGSRSRRRFSTTTRSIRGRSGRSTGRRPRPRARPRRASARSRERGDDLLEHRQRARAAERDDLAARLELGEEEDLVDQLARVLDLGARLLDQLRDVGARQVALSSSTRIRASGVRSSCETAAVKPGAQLLVGGRAPVATSRKSTSRSGVARPRCSSPSRRPGSSAAEQRLRRRARGHDPPLAVEHDHRLAAARHERAGLSPYRPFTTSSPFLYPSPTRYAADNE